MKTRDKPPSRGGLERLAGLLMACVVLATAPLAAAQTIEASFNRSAIRLDDGNATTLAVMVENGGDDTVQLTPHATATSPLVVASEPQPFTLEAGENRAVYVSVLVPTGTPPGDYELNVELTSTNARTMRATATVHVRARREIEIAEVRAAQGEEASSRSFLIAIGNAGNTTETLAFHATATPTAGLAFEPDTATVAPGQRLEVRLDVDSRITSTSQQRIDLKVTSAGTGEVLAVRNLGFRVLGSTAKLQETWRELGFSVRVSYTPGPNFVNGEGLPFGVSIFGGGLISTAGNQRVRATLATPDFRSVSFAGAYQSDTVDLAVGSAVRGYSELGFTADGFGVTLDARFPEQGVGLGAYVLGTSDLSALTGVGAQVRGETKGLGASLSFAYAPEAARGVLSAAAAADLLAIESGDDIAEGDVGAGSDEAGETGEEQKAIDEVRAELDEAAEDLPRSEEEGDEVTESLEASLLEPARREPTPLSLATIAAEGAVDTRSGVAGRVEAGIGAGPATFTADVGGSTTGFRGATSAERTWGVSGNVLIGSLDGFDVGVGARYQADDSFPASGGASQQRDTFAVGLGVNTTAASVALTYSSTLGSIAGTDIWALNQRFGVSAHALIDEATVATNLTLLTSNASSGSAGATGSVLRVSGTASVPFDGGAVSTEGSALYDLTSQELVNLEGEAIAVISDLGDIPGNLRFGVRYRRSAEAQWVTGLLRWAGRVTPSVKATAGLQGTMAFQEGSSSRWLTTSLSADTRLPIGHDLGFAGQVRLSDTGNHTVSVSASYTVPFTVQVARVEGVGDIRGLVSDSNGEPVPGVELVVGPAAVRTDEHGEFQVLGLPVGEYALLATGGADGMVTDPDLPLSVSVQDRSVTDLRITLHPAATVEGRVTLATPEPRPGVVFGSGDRLRDAMAISGMRIRLVGSEREYLAVAGPAGRLDFPPILPGTYSVQVDTDLGPLYAVEVDHPVLTLEAGQATALEVIVHPLPRLIQMQETGRAGEGND